MVEEKIDVTKYFSEYAFILKVEYIEYPNNVGSKCRFFFKNGTTIPVSFYSKEDEVIEKPELITERINITTKFIKRKENMKRINESYFLDCLFYEFSTETNRFNEMNELYEFYQPDTKTINEFKLKEACDDMGVEMPERIEGYEYI
jgi:hypothetical protein